MPYRIHTGVVTLTPKFGNCATYMLMLYIKNDKVVCFSFPFLLTCIHKIAILLVQCVYTSYFIVMHVVIRMDTI